MHCSSVRAILGFWLRISLKASVQETESDVSKKSVFLDDETCRPRPHHRQHIEGLLLSAQWLDWLPGLSRSARIPGVSGGPARPGVRTETVDVRQFMEIPNPIFTNRDLGLFALARMLLSI